MKRLFYLAVATAVLSGCGQPAKTYPAPNQAKTAELTWQTVRVFSNYADEEQVSFRYPNGRWLENLWTYKKPDFAKIVTMYPAENGIICEGLGLFDVRGKSVTTFDKLQTEAVSDGHAIFTTDPQTSDYVKAVNTVDGATLWQSRIGEKARGDGEFFFVDGNLVFLLETPQGYRVTRFDRKSGSIVWQVILPIESGFSSRWAVGSGEIWILTTIQSEGLKNILSRINARTGETNIFDCPFRESFAVAGGYLWYLKDGSLVRFNAVSGQSIPMPARDSLSIQNISDFLLLNSTKQPKVLDPKDATNHMLFPDQVQSFGGVVFQVLQKMIVAVDPITREELWKMDFSEAVQSVVFSPACVAVQTTQNIYFFWKK